MVDPSAKHILIGGPTTYGKQFPKRSCCIGPSPAVSRNGSAHPAHPAHRWRNRTRCCGHAVRWCNHHGSRITARSPQHAGHTAGASRVFPCAPMSGHSAIGSTAGNAGRGCKDPHELILVAKSLPGFCPHVERGDYGAWSRGKTISPPISRVAPFATRPAPSIHPAVSSLCSRTGDRRCWRDQRSSCGDFCRIGAPRLAKPAQLVWRTATHERGMGAPRVGPYTTRGKGRTPTLPTIGPISPILPLQIKR